VRFDWDEAKNAANRKKHGIGFETAALVFDDPRHISILDRHVEGEERWQTLGRIGPFVVVMVAHVVKDIEGEEIIRIVSARRATAHERRAYDQET